MTQNSNFIAKNDKSSITLLSGPVQSLESQEAKNTENEIAIQLKAENARILSIHPNCDKLALPANLAESHKQQLEKGGLTLTDSFASVLLNSFKELINGSRSSLAAKLASLGIIELVLKYNLSVTDFIFRDYTCYLFSGIISSGGLLFVLAVHPIYFLPEPLAKLEQLTNIALGIEKELAEFLIKTFPKELNLALNIIKFKKIKKKMVGMVLIGLPKAALLNFLQYLFKGVLQFYHVT